MPSIKNKEVAQVVAQAYCSNGHNKTQAMVTAGYSHKYADTGAGQKFVFGNVRTIAAIESIEADTAQRTELTIDFIQAEHKRLAKICEDKGDFVNATRNLEGAAKTIGAYRDGSAGAEDVTRLLTDADRQALIYAAKLLTKPKPTIKLHTA